MISKRIRAALLGLSLFWTARAGWAEPAVVDTGVTSWMLTSTTLVLLMVPGLALFYGGLVRTKNVLGTMMHSFVCMALVGVLWVVCGYALAFGPNTLGGWIGWNSDLLFLKGIENSIMSSGVPEYVFSMFQGKFAIITPALIAGAFAERVKFKGYCIYTVLWFLLIYCPVCHWVWASDGYLFNLGAKGAIDFAGGTVVHITAGVSALVAALYLGARRGYPVTAMHPNNLVMTLLGAGLLWVGWFGFNAGSSVSSGLDTARALAVTQAAAAAGALCWVLIEAVAHGKATSLGFSSGILAGLVAITPAAGVVTPYGALILGFAASLICYGAITIKTKLGYDDSLDVFGVHGMAGIFGALALSFLIRPTWMEEASAVKPGWNAMQQFFVQAQAVGMTIAYTVVVSYLLVLIVDKLFGFRADKREEMAGLDATMHGEQGYGLINLN